MTNDCRFCVSCRHFKKTANLGQCMRNAYDEIDVVTGEIKFKNGKSVYVERASGFIEALLFGQCGKRGRFWEQTFIKRAAKN